MHAAYLAKLPLDWPASCELLRIDMLAATKAAIIATTITCRVDVRRCQQKEAMKAKRLLASVEQSFS